ncbi:MAG: hypothetical protein Q9165_002645 [Trypethelium subeluteriae]
MAAILIGTGAVIAQKIREKRKAKKAARREYDEEFDNLMAANAARVRHISQSSMDMPPAYEEIIGNGSRPSRLTANTQNDVQQPVPFQRQISSSATTMTSDDAVSRRDMATR